MAAPAALDPDPINRETVVPVDFGFLATQTFDDLALQIEVLDLFVAQARRLMPGLATLDVGGQGDVAHLLKGSARGIGAWPAAAAAEAYEAAAPADRATVHGGLAATFAQAEAAILAWLELRRGREPGGL